jgi:glycosyltransferase involved in cell wall biosynthesis
VVDWKGVREFLLATRQVMTQIPEARAFIVGGHSDGDEGFVREMRGLAVELGIADRVIFTGYRQDVPALMKLMDVVVHASTRPEPFGMVVIEGMAMEKPVVATQGGGPCDIVAEGETGFLVKMGDSEALGRAIITLLRQPGLRREMGKRGRKRVVEFFNNGSYAAKMEDIFSNLTEKQQVSGRSIPVCSSDSSK